jgi:hypothetical protein
MNADELRRKLGLPKAGRVVEISADEFRKAGDAQTALRMREEAERKAQATTLAPSNKVTVRVIGRPPSINEYLRGLKSCIQAKKYYSERCIDGWMRADKPRLIGPFKLTVHMLLSGTDFDPSNLYQGGVKVFLDAMQSIGCIEQDNWKTHVGPDKYSWRNANHDIVEFTLSAATKRKF